MVDVWELVGLGGHGLDALVLKDEIVGFADKTYGRDVYKTLASSSAIIRSRASTPSCEEDHTVLTESRGYKLDYG